ncbi:MAG: Crp/Fnr family transcriptional regulator [Clostridiaceae bacterium]
MKNIFEILNTSALFKNIEINEIQKIIERTKHKIINYEKEEIIAFQGDLCDKIGIVLDGMIEIKNMMENGKSITITSMKAGNIFGEVILFSNQKSYPSTIEANSKSTILFLHKTEVLGLCRENELILNNFMSLLSNKILMLNQKLKSLSYNTIRQKLVYYFIQEYEKQNTPFITLPYSRAELAEYLGIPRPSLSREMVKMKEDNLIDFEKNTVKIINFDALKEFLL